MKQPSLFPLEEYTKLPQISEDQIGVLEFELGKENALTIIKALGGLSIKVPRQPNGTDYEFFEQKLGLELARLLVLKFGGEEIYIVRNRAKEARSIHREAIQIFRNFVSQGNSRRRAVHLTALQLGRSARNIYYILDEYKV